MSIIMWYGANRLITDEVLIGCIDGCRLVILPGGMARAKIFFRQLFLARFLYVTSKNDYENL